jgi:hypothetical protein
MKEAANLRRPLDNPSSFLDQAPVSTACFCKDIHRDLFDGASGDVATILVNQADEFVRIAVPCADRRSTSALNCSVDLRHVSTSRLRSSERHRERIWTITPQIGQGPNHAFGTSKMSLACQVFRMIAYDLNTAKRMISEWT